MMPTPNETPLFNFLNNIFYDALRQCESDAAREKVYDAIRYYSDAFKSFDTVDFSIDDFSELKTKLVSELKTSLIQYSEIAEHQAYDVYLVGLVRDLFKIIDSNLKNKFPESYSQARAVEMLLHNSHVKLLRKIHTAAECILDERRRSDIQRKCTLLISSCTPPSDSVYRLAIERSEFSDDLLNHLNLNINNIPTALVDASVDKKLISDLLMRTTLLKKALDDIERARMQFSFNTNTHAVSTLNEMHDQCRNYIKKYSDLSYQASIGIDLEAIPLKKETFDKDLLAFIKPKKEYFDNNEKNGLTHSFSSVVNRIFHHLRRLLSLAYRKQVDFEFKPKRQKVCDILNTFGIFDQSNNNNNLLKLKKTTSPQPQFGR